MKFCSPVLGLLTVSLLSGFSATAHAAIVTPITSQTPLAESSGAIAQYGGDDDGHPRLRLQRARGFLQNAIEFARAKEYQTALNELERALLNQPDLWEAYYTRGVIWLKVGETEAALQDFSTAIRINPNHGQSYFNLGVVFRRLGDIPAAYNSYVRSAEIYRANGQMADYQEALNAIERLRR